MKLKSSFLLLGSLLIILACNGLFKPIATATAVVTSPEPPVETTTQVKSAASPSSQPTDSEIPESAVPTSETPQQNENIAATSANKNSLCYNDYFPVVKGAKWIYAITINQNSKSTVSYALNEIINIRSDGFDMAVYASQTEEFKPSNNPALQVWVCLPDGLGVTATTHAAIPKEMHPGLTWELEGQGNSVIYTSLGLESVTVPAGTFDAIKVSFASCENCAPTFEWFTKGIGLIKIFGGEENANFLSQELLSYSIPAQ